MVVPAAQANGIGTEACFFKGRTLSRGHRSALEYQASLRNQGEGRRIARFGRAQVTFCCNVPANRFGYRWWKPLPQPVGPDLLMLGIGATLKFVPPVQIDEMANIMEECGAYQMPLRTRRNGILRT